MNKAMWIANQCQVPIVGHPNQAADVLVVSLTRVTKAEPHTTLRVGLNNDGTCTLVNHYKTKSVERNVVVTFPANISMMVVWDKEEAKRLLCAAVDEAFNHPPFDQR